MISLCTREECKKAMRAAYEKGFEIGYDEGYTNAAEQYEYEGY